MGNLSVQERKKAYEKELRAREDVIRRTIKKNCIGGVRYVRLGDILDFSYSSMEWDKILSFTDIVYDVVKNEFHLTRNIREDKSSTLRAFQIRGNSGCSVHHDYVCFAIQSAYFKPKTSDWIRELSDIEIPLPSGDIQIKIANLLNRKLVSVHDIREWENMKWYMYTQRMDELFNIEGEVKYLKLLDIVDIVDIDDVEDNQSQDESIMYIDDTPPFKWADKMSDVSDTDIHIVKLIVGMEEEIIFKYLYFAIEYVMSSISHKIDMDKLYIPVPDKKVQKDILDELSSMMVMRYYDGRHFIKNPKEYEVEYQKMRDRVLDFKRRDEDE